MSQSTGMPVTEPGGPGEGDAARDEMSDQAGQAVTGEATGGDAGGGLADAVGDVHTVGEPAGAQEDVDVAVAAADAQGGDGDAAASADDSLDEDADVATAELGHDRVHSAQDRADYPAAPAGERDVRSTSPARSDAAGADATLPADTAYEPVDVAGPGPDPQSAGGELEGEDTEVNAGGGKRARMALLEREGEVAADFLERLLDIADLDGDIDVDIDGDRAAVAIVDSDEGRVPRRLVGPEGRVLDALQELTRLAVQTATGERSRLMLDVAGFRAERRSTLVALAQSAIGEVRESGQPASLADMTAFERKVVHDEVTAAGLVSESEGVEPHRHIVIRLAEGRG